MLVLFFIIKLQQNFTLFHFTDVVARKQQQSATPQGMLGSCYNFCNNNGKLSHHVVPARGYGTDAVDLLTTTIVAPQGMQRQCYLMYNHYPWTINQTFFIVVQCCVNKVEIDLS